MKKMKSFKRTCTLFLSLIIFITSDSDVWEVLTVSAAESRSVERVITSFSPLPLEVSEQNVCVGTPIEELELPDTLEALCSYKRNNENDSPDDKTKEDDKIADDTDDTDDTDDAGDTDDADDTDTTDDADDAGDTDNPGNTDDTSGSDNSDGAADSDDTDDAADSDNTGDSEDSKAPDDDSGKNDGKDDGSGEAGEDTGDETDGDASGEGEQKGDENDSGTIGAEDTEEGSETADNEVNEATENSGTDTDNSEDKQIDDTSDISAGEQFDSEKAAVTAMIKGTMAAAVIAKCKRILSPEIFRDNNFVKLYSLSTGGVHETGVENIPESNTESEMQTLTGTVIIKGVTWECTSEYDSETPDRYVFTPVLPDSLVLAEDVVLPDIIVIIEEKDIEPKAMERVRPFGLLEDSKNGNCGADGDNLTWEYDDNGTLTIRGTGEMADFEISGAPWNNYKNEIENIRIDDGATSIGKYAFYDCSAVSSLQLPGSVTSIGDYAFCGCSSLGIIEITDSVRNVSANSFENCYNAVLYYPAELADKLSAVESVKANIKYIITGGSAGLEIVMIDSGVSSIEFPAAVGGGVVVSANWKAYENVDITHLSEHNYDEDGVCAICGNKKEPEPEPEEKPEAIIDYVNEKLTGLIGGAGYLINSEEITADSDGRITINDYWMRDDEVSIVKIGDGITTRDSEEQLLRIPARPDAPEGIEKEDESAEGAGNGRITNVDDTMEYQKDGDSSWEAVSGTSIDNLAPGTYYVCYKAVEGQSFRSDPEEITIYEYEFRQEETIAVEIDFYRECFINLEPEEVYIINRAEVQADESGEIPINSIWMKGKNVSIIKKENDNSTTGSIVQTIFVPKRRSAPKGVRAVPESAKEENDGKLIGVNETMEYCEWRSGDWNSVVNDMVEDLEPGAYEVRYMATGDSFASFSVAVRVYPYGYTPKNKDTGDYTQSSEESSSDNPEDTDVSGTSDNSGSSDNKLKQSDSNTNESAEDRTSKEALSPTQKKKGISNANVSETSSESPETELEPEQENNGGLAETEDDIFYIPSIVHEGKIVLKSEDDVWEETYDNGVRKVFFMLGHGGVLLNINNMDESVCKANISDVVAAVNAILTTQEIVQSDKGDIAEIRIDIECVDNSFPKADIDLIEKGIDDCNNEGLALGTGMYMDISIFKRTDGYEWENVNALSEPIEVSLYIPDSIKALSDEFYVMRVHGGEYKLLNDMDDNADTITVQTHLFSTYALLYKLDDANLYAEGEMDGKQGGYSIAQTFLEKGGFVWLAVILSEMLIIIMLIIIMIAMNAKNKKAKGNESHTENRKAYL